MPKQLERLEDLTPDPGNANLGTERGAIQVENSLRDYGAGRSIVVDKDGVVIAGNKTLESAADIGLPIEVVQTDGTKLVVVQRTDLKLGSEDNRARLLAYADNRASEVGLHWDVDQIRADLESGINIDEMFRKDEIDDLLSETRSRDQTDLSGVNDVSSFRVLVQADDEAQQVEIIRLLDERGYKCQPLML